MTLGKRNLCIALVAAAGCLAASSVAASGPEPRGRIHLDYAFHDEDVREFADGHRLRRARIGVDGVLDDDWSYQSEIDFAENGVGFRDVYLRYSGLETGDLTIGQFKVPFSMDELTSSNHLTFIERALPNAFPQSRRVGIGLAGGGADFGYSVMGFGQGVGSNNERVDAAGDENFGIGARLFGSPVRTDSSLLHLGIGVTTEAPNHREDETVRFRARPESRPTGVRLVDTGTIEDVDRMNRFSLESGWQSGPLTLQGEYLGVDVNRDNGEDYSFDGYYAQASWVVTGQRKEYISWRHLPQPLAECRGIGLGAGVALQQYRSG